MTETPGDGNTRCTETPEQQARREIDRQNRLIDQSMTAHSVLRDRYRFRAMAMMCFLLAASVFATAFAFASGDTRVVILSLSMQRSTWLGWFAVLTFTSTLFDLVVDWRGTMRKHEDAVRQLAALKTEYRTPPEVGAEIAERDRRSQRYQAVMDSIPNLPERQFVHLKALHLRKIELSRILSNKPGMTARQARRELRRRLKR